MRRDAFVINGMRPLFAEPTASEEELTVIVGSHLPKELDAARAVRRMRRALDDARTRATADRLQSDRLRQRAGRDQIYVEVPAFEEDVHDLAALAEVAAYLTGARTLPAVVS